MKKPKPQRKQATPEELLTRLLDFLQRKFYQGHAVAFAKDRPRLLAWVVLWPAKWFDSKGVTLSPERYAEIFFQIFLEAHAHSADEIKYLPAWLASVLKSHFRIHGEAYYEEAKSMRNLTETALLVAGQARQAAAPDPVRELAQAARLLKIKKLVKKPAVNDQLTLL